MSRIHDSVLRGKSLLQGDSCNTAFTSRSILVLNLVLVFALAFFAFVFILRLTVTAVAVAIIVNVVLLPKLPSLILMLNLSSDLTIFYPVDDLMPQLTRFNHHVTNLSVVGKHLKT